MSSPKTRGRVYKNLPVKRSVPRKRSSSSPSRAQAINLASAAAVGGAGTYLALKALQFARSPIAWTGWQFGKVWAASRLLGSLFRRSARVRERVGIKLRSWVARRRIRSATPVAPGVYVTKRGRVVTSEDAFPTL